MCFPYFVSDNGEIHYTSSGTAVETFLGVVKFRVVKATPYLRP